MDLNLSEMYMAEIIDDVDSMHRLFMQNAHSLPISDIDDHTIEFRRRLIREESHETRDALDQFNKVEVADGLCDMAVVCAGTKVEFGRVHTPSIGSYHGQKYISSLLNNTIADIETPHTIIRDVDMLTIVSDYVLAAFITLSVYRPDLNLWNNYLEVMRANRKKVFRDRESAEKDSKAYVEKGIDTHVVFNNECNCYIILRNDGKFMKPMDWEKPNIIVY